MNFELQLVQLPVSDVDRAKAFYTEQAGFTATPTSSSARTCASCS